METIFDDLTEAVKASQRSPRLGIALATFAILAACVGVGLAIKSPGHHDQLPTVDIGQILHPGVV
ncbi:hypothetical protein FKO01_36080 [Mesorhizobium sp. B2-3-3]|uniref:hypothetical protein n=1 Tax=unclassified Mesorhizobium TaxID=325217 RepID=UPI00112AD779|nr:MULTISPECIES: hypothetical protein [unclassified Mesorhizobium]TPK77164.1 hypothetical protein FJ930_00600 [Mesorhizobium sp. B2-4-15]TPM24386.1 hypothetical protein FJ958_23275 [Mesorhizobium sp. B2-3-5]TPN18292.1 hypothetical protein FKO01_36080 [Mesorhizobium sp. B2-3-3]